MQLANQILQPAPAYTHTENGRRMMVGGFVRLLDSCVEENVFGFFEAD